MDVFVNFKDLFLSVWQQGIAGVNFTQVTIAIFILFFFLILRGFIAKFILKRLENYVSKTSNKFVYFVVITMLPDIKALETVLVKRLKVSSIHSIRQIQRVDVSGTLQVEVVLTYPYF